MVIYQFLSSPSSPVIDLNTAQKNNKKTVSQISVSLCGYMERSDSDKVQVETVKF